MPERRGARRFEWERLVTDLPSRSPLWRHDERCGSGCWRKDGSRLSPATLKHVALTMAIYAQAEDDPKNGRRAGEHIYPGVGYPAHKPESCPFGERGAERCEIALDGLHEASGLVRKASRHRSTIIAAQDHLERVGLIARKVRAGARGVPRSFATEWMLVTPSEEELAAIGIRPPWAEPQPDPQPAAEPDPQPQPAAEPDPQATHVDGPAAGPDPERMLEGVMVPAEPYDWFTRRRDSPVLAMNGAHRGDVDAAAAARKGGPGPAPPYP